MASTELTVDVNSAHEYIGEVVELTKSLERLSQRIRDSLLRLTAIDDLPRDGACVVHSAAAATDESVVRFELRIPRVETIRAALLALDLDAAHKALDSLED